MSSYEVAARRYEPPYDFYDAANDQDDLSELLDPRREVSNGAEYSFLLMTRVA